MRREAPTTTAGHERCRAAPAPHPAPPRPVPRPLAADPLFRLQRHAGNAAVQEMSSGTRHREHDGHVPEGPAGVLQCCSESAGECSPCRQARVGHGASASGAPNAGAEGPGIRVADADSPLERAADRLADRVLRARAPIPAAGQGTGDGSGTAGGVSAGRGPAPRMPGIVGQVLAAPGRPLDPGDRGFFEPRLGRELSDVRVHDDERAAASARSVGALAYTLGSHIVFGTGRYAPGSMGGRRLLAHELAHVVQQRGGELELMRTPIFSSTMEICHRVLESRHFHVSDGAIFVTAYARSEPTAEAAEGLRCGGVDYNVTLNKERLGPDPEYGTCTPSQGHLVTLAWGGLPEGDYYLTIWTKSSTPFCCLEGDVHVSQEKNYTGASCTQLPPGTLEMVHDALALAGMVPVLGVAPDAVDAGLYLIEGDWTSAGLSLVFMVPYFGDAASVVRRGERLALRAARADADRLGKKGITEVLEKAKAAEKEGGRLGKQPHIPEPPHGRPRVKGLPGCWTGSPARCYFRYIRQEFPDLIRDRRNSEFAPYLRGEFDELLQIGPSLRKEQTIKSGEAIYAEFLSQAKRHEWSEPFRNAVDAGPCREIRVGGRPRRWPLDELGDPWVVHHDPPLQWIEREGSHLWHPMPARIHSIAHDWWHRFRRAFVERTG